MANMSYCRFRNTLNDLRDCYQELTDGKADDSDLSVDERVARDQLIEMCQDIATDHGEYFEDD